MRFDFATAIAKLGGPVDGLMDRHPDLGFIFSQREDLLHDVEEYGDAAVLSYDKEQAGKVAERATETVGELVARLTTIADLLRTLEKMSALDAACLSMVNSVAKMSEEAVEYANKVMD